jgi:hypothetical protein
VKGTPLSFTLGLIGDSPLRVLYLVIVMLLSACTNASRKDAAVSTCDLECYPGYEADVLVDQWVSVVDF